MTRPIGLAIVALLALPAGQASAQKWPSRNIEMIIPFGAGSGVDIIGRGMAAALTEQLHQQVIVSNRPGASGTIGFNALAGAEPNGYTIGWGPTTPIANAPYLVKGTRYDPHSFDYICQVFENVFAIAVLPDSPFKSAQDLFAAARANPGRVSYGHAGNGTIPHLSMENMADALGLKFQSIPFSGDAAILPTLMKGDIDFSASGISTIRGQNFRALAVFAAKRHPAYPDAPTERELGVPVSVPPGHNGLYAPKGLPGDVHGALERGCAEVTKSEAVSRATENTGQSITYLGSRDFYAQTVADYTFKGDLIRRLGLATP